MVVLFFSPIPIRQKVMQPPTTEHKPNQLQPLLVLSYFPRKKQLILKKMYTQESFLIHIKNEKAISYLYKLSLISVEAGMQPKFINKRKGP